jgi:hypothetical protein
VADLKMEGLPVLPEPDTQNEKGNRRRQMRRHLVAGSKAQFNIPPIDEAWEVELTDVSPGGVGFISRKELPRGTIVMFRFAGQRIYGLVGYCHGSAARYHVGVKITDAVDE